MTNIQTMDELMHTLWLVNPMLAEQIQGYQAELAALRPLAALGERAVRNNWWAFAPQGVRLCLVCMTFADRHTPNCPIPTLLAQLDKEGKP